MVRSEWTRLLQGVGFVCCMAAPWHSLGSASLPPFLRSAGLSRRQSAQTGWGGYLTKKGQLVRSWKRRYFHLSLGTVEYFEDYDAFTQNCRNGVPSDDRHSDLDAMAPFRPKGGILLVGAKVVMSSHDNQMDIVCEDRTLTVRADDRDSLVQWHTQLNLHIDLANEDALAMNDVSIGVVEWLGRIGQISVEAQERLKVGCVLEKYCASAVGRKKRRRFFRLSDNGDKLVWGRSKEDVEKSKLKEVTVAMMMSVEAGGGNVSRGKENEHTCLRIVTTERELNVEAPDQATRDSWVRDLYAISYYHSLNVLQGNLGIAMAKQMSTPRGNLRKAIDSHAQR